MDNGGDGSRLGMAVSRRAMRRAVARNRYKRLAREVFRQHRSLLPATLDLVLVARKAALSVTFADMMEDFRRFCRFAASHEAR